MTIRVSGFLIVRLPDMNRDPSGRGAFPNRAPCLETIFYGGIDRMPWFDIDEDVYSRSAPQEIALLRKNITENNADFTGIELCRDVDQALTLLHYSNRVRKENEIIVVRSQRLGEIKGTITVEGSRVAWSGCDVVALGYWSLLREGVFVASERFSKWRLALNSFGLLPSSVDFDGYIDDYKRASLDGVVEEIPSSAHGIDIIEVGKLQNSNVTV